MMRNINDIIGKSVKRAVQRGPETGCETRFAAETGCEAACADSEEHDGGPGVASVTGRSHRPCTKVTGLKAAVLIAAAAALTALVCIAARIGSGRAVNAEGRPVMTLSKDEPAPGESIVLTIGYEADEEITGSIIIVQFGSRLEFVSSNKSGMLADTVSFDENKPNTVTILQAEGNGTGKGTLCTITLKVADDSQRDVDEEIVLTMTEYSNGDYDNFYPNTTFRRKIYIPATPKPTTPPTSAPTPARTPTATNTPTQTPTATKTPTQTQAATKTPTQTPTATNTPSRTPTRTPAPTKTANVTDTPASPASATATLPSDASPDLTQDPNGSPDGPGTEGPGEATPSDGFNTDSPDSTDNTAPGMTPDNTADTPNASLAPVSPADTYTLTPGGDFPTAELQPTRDEGRNVPENNGEVLPGGDSDPDGGSFTITRRSMALWVFAAAIAGIWIGVAVGFLVWGRKGKREGGNGSGKGRGRDVFIVILTAAILFGFGRTGSPVSGNAYGAELPAADNLTANVDGADILAAAGTEINEAPEAAPAATDQAETTVDPASPADGTDDPADVTPDNTDAQNTPGPDDSTPGGPTETRDPAETPDEGTDATPTPADDVTPTQGETGGETPGGPETIDPSITPDFIPTEELPTGSPTPFITDVPTEVPTRTPYPTRTPTAVPDATTPPTLSKLTPPPLNDATRIPATDEKGNIIEVTDAPSTTARTEHVGTNEENTTYRLSDFIKTLCYIAYGLAAMLLLIGLIRIIWLLVFKKDIVPPAPKEEDNKKKRRLNKSVDTDDVEVSHDNWN